MKVGGGWLSRRKRKRGVEGCSNAEKRKRKNVDCEKKERERETEKERSKERRNATLLVIR